MFTDPYPRSTQLSAIVYSHNFVCVHHLAEEKFPPGRVKSTGDQKEKINVQKTLSFKFDSKIVLKKRKDSEKVPYLET
jgi:hypothetical protein